MRDGGELERARQRLYWMRRQRERAEHRYDGLEDAKKAVERARRAEKQAENDVAQAERRLAI
jgi:hypothetical protein